jgi:3-hydroxyacyl-[acyl-carrier-protein] dehydratase
MVTESIIDLDSLDLSATALSNKEVLKLNAQRDEFEQIDKLIHLDVEGGIAVGIKKQKKDEFWTRGHIPGRPLMPGVMMIEMAAQLGSLLFHKKFKTEGKKFFGFGGVNNVKFRGAVEPGSTFIMMAKSIKMRSKIAVFHAQGYVDGKMVFEGDITGIIF